MLPVKFVRQSDDGRLTLVVDPKSKPVSVLWAELDVSDLSEAVEKLRVREGATNIRNIGGWPNGGALDYADDIGAWAQRKGISGVVWTALGPKFSGKLLRPTKDEAIGYLRQLTGDTLDLAREYVENAPKQIDTDYRRAFANAFGWVSG